MLKTNLVKWSKLKIISSPETRDLSAATSESPLTFLASPNKMSKTKTKRRHRELKRESARKLAVSHRKNAASPGNITTSNARNPPAKKQKLDTAITNKSPSSSKLDLQPSVRSSQASQKHPIPFGVYDKILLVGEGDFSFTRSLVIEHGCANVTATSYDSLEEVTSKYPRFSSIQDELSALVPPVPLHHSIDATKIATYKTVQPASSENIDDVDEAPNADGSVGKGTWDTIAFMFPHTGGLSTDVNRQARANQSLIVSFFTSCLTHKPPKSPKHSNAAFLKPGGKILVSLFEGEQYDRWCIRNLARHVGLVCKTSYKFDWKDYPGYKHVRTLGVVEGGGGWKGEEREARMFVFEKAKEEGSGEKEEKKVKKRKREGDGALGEKSESEDSDDG
ncbi:unnamed protein product [Periconia digitata]|uniref:25S rRNA (uridine-N(3))-methyltransferase BMT5-like domain-containing protein n=1 Tax=Periconia digitata TaxID=1303443 RepID=A0A9W4UEU6_9PLEO|nr:unnamed protein product [Periconia digitata]